MTDNGYEDLPWVRLRDVIRLCSRPLLLMKICSSGVNGLCSRKLHEGLQCLR